MSKTVTMKGKPLDESAASIRGSSVILRGETAPPRQSVGFHKASGERQTEIEKETRALNKTMRRTLGETDARRQLVRNKDARDMFDKLGL